LAFSSKYGLHTTSAVTQLLLALLHQYIFEHEDTKVVIYLPATNWYCTSANILQPLISRKKHSIYTMYLRQATWKQQSHTHWEPQELRYTLTSFSYMTKAQHLYSALHGIQTTLKRSGMDHTVLPAINTIPAVYLVSVHQMAPPPTEVANIQLQLTTHLSTPKGW